MLVSTQPRQKRNSTKVNLVVSAIFHAVILGALLYFAARNGLLGKQIKKIAVEMVREKPKQPEKPKEPEKPKVEVAKVEAPKPAAVEKAEAPKEVAAPPPPAVDVVPSVAPPAAELPAFSFDGGKPVVTSSDPVQVYKGLLESSLRFNWDRPKDADDHDYVAVVEISVDKSGNISDPAWKQKSGHRDWDNSVWAAIQSTPRVSRPPPPKFPSSVAVKFDVEAMQAVPQ